MITLNELNYVNSWAKKAPYPGIKYAGEAINKLRESVEIYKQLYSEKTYDLVLSNGEQLQFEIQDKNLCHMLGIDFRNLSSDYFDVFREEILKLTGKPRAYELLNAIIENAESVLKCDEEHMGTILNYYKIMVKCSIFEKLSDFNRFDFGIINFNKPEYEKNSSHTYASNAEKFLYVQSNEQTCPYFMMGIVKTDPFEIGPKEEYGSSKYAVETLFAPIQPKNFFLNQTVCIPTQILTTTKDAMTKKEATPAHKIALLNQYRAIISEYNIPNNIDIYADYMATLSNEKNTNNKVLVKTI